jgi:predicted DNA-binding protein with PD1-like motif
MKVHVTERSRVIVLRLDTDDDILQGLRLAVEQHGIRHATITGAIGSVKRYHFHVVSTAEMPPQDDFVRVNHPADIVGLTGFVLDGRVHAHITFSDADRAVGGHLEEGCQVLAFCLITLVELPDLDLTEADRWWRGDNPYLAPAAPNS